MAFSVIASAPAKAYLIGEHAVVYGEPAIVFAIDKRTYVKAEKSDLAIIKDKDILPTRCFVKNIKDFSKQATDLWKECNEKQERDKFSELREFMKKDKTNPLKIAVGITLEELGIDSGVFYQVSSEIPRDMGLGSSAAFSVATPLAISKIYDIDLPKPELNEIAYKIERINHGTPSGADNTVSCYGGVIKLEKGNIEHLDIPKLKDFFIVDTGKSERTTEELVTHVRDLDAEYRDPFIKSLGNDSIKMEQALKSEDYKTIEALMNEAHKKLAWLGVSNNDMNRVNEDIKKIGGGSKLLGAGKGVMLCHHAKKEKLIDYFEGLDYNYFDVELGTEGAKIEQ
jgi:mevalonate kinase